MPHLRARVAALVVVAALLAPPPSAAWPLPVVESLTRDARRLLPGSLARLMHDREKEMFLELQRFPPELSRALAYDQVQGRLTGTTINALDARTAHVVDLLRKGRVNEGVLAMAGLVRIAADLSDPALASADAYPPGVLGEYYAFVQVNIDKIPVVLSDPPALQLRRDRLPGYWQSMLDASRGHSPVIRTEMWRGGRVVPHQRIDFRNPVFGVASLAYSRAVTGIAATWLAIWREAQGDLTRQPKPKEVVARPAPPLASPAGPVLQGAQQ